MSVSVDTRELKRLERSFRGSGKDFEKGSQRLLDKLGVWVLGKARSLCPESPTLAMYARMNKSGKTERDRTSITTGSLRDSITLEKGKLQVEIGIPRNSKAKEYAKKIHDERGKTWKNLGPHSKQKNATDKFIYKAYDESKDKQSELVDLVIKEFTRGIGI